ncbi:bifunctional diaminohydroxyphosphoribosylaminopyrimidine deaminase/5-amino-6-(5-phosphoribosylamino)uracil reductase RibD [Methyloferula stellata]|uniref:bifunctional diaminohydroxyphosphoribosylaminopyrimidine deaminase/5-amino-6-(5-phosphoribosylamino)uracil reductase RibD n=1 Tax=Methyloferula stellata TaxID=876270 RepID=UPI00037533D8|nr:bifunctional diaminohydroxyphosphoribosylaminopyrimidine deaminase/5-amino-6-(5-phosphoribosylamino)uracil reductase RibD [Methyloferula stellata]
MSHIEEDARLMAAALSFSRRSLGLAAPNPSVGALVVKDGLIVGRGVTGQGGRPHGEVLALEEAGELAKGAMLYVTLEPCSHHGKTPPCVDAIIAAGIARVVSAIGDPNPKVAGEGYRRLREAGVEVVTGVCEEEARRLHLGHFLCVTAGRPMVTLKLAETADGYAADVPGAPRLVISGELTYSFVHMQRALYDAILIGSGTALADDPLLTVRLPGLEARKPLRVVLDTKLLLSPASWLAVTATEVPTLVVAGDGADGEAVKALEAKHVEVATVPCDKAGHVDLNAALRLLAGRGITRVLSEGGPHLGAALIAAGIADEVLILTSQKSLGREGLPALDAAANARLADETHYRFAETRILGEDRLMRYERTL